MTASQDVRGEGRLQLPESMGMVVAVVAFCAILLAGMRALMPLMEAVSIEDYLAFHGVVEVLAVAVAAMIFGVGWHAARENGSTFLVLLSAAFLSVGLLDLAHLLSYAGMPHFITPPSPEKAINFWLAARITAAVALLAAVLAHRLPAWPNLRYKALATALAWTATVYGVLFFQPEWMPATFVPGQGMTAFKVGAEFAIIGILVLVVVAILAFGRSARSYAPHSLLAAVCLMILSEMAFTYYVRVSDWINLLGHVYKIMAYGFLYHGVFVVAVRQPYLELSASVQAARESEARFRLMFDATPDAVFLVDARDRVVLANRMAETLLGYGQDELIGRQMTTFFPDESGKSARMHGLRSEIEALRKDGTAIPVTANLSTVFLGTQWQSIVVVRDISASREMENLLRRSSQEFSALVDNAQDVIVRFDRDLRFLYANPAIYKAIGRTHEECLGKTWEELDLPTDAATIWEHRIKVVFNSCKEAMTECGMDIPTVGPRHYHLRMTPELDREDKVTSVLVIARDISERKRHENQLRHHATHDLLTGLPNRALVLDRLEQAITHAQRTQRLLVVACLDLNHFKDINDTLGHSVGDELLRQAAARIKGVLRPGDTLGRHGGDEFILLLTDILNMHDVSGVAEKILGALDKPFTVCGREMYLGGSLGLSVYPQNSDDAEVLLRNADVAMYRAKEEGRNIYRFYAADMDARMRMRVETEQDLRHAIERGELELHYQPRISLASGEILGLEALVRWNHPREGLVGPGRFIGVAEDTGLIVPLGYWVLEEACRRARQWQDDGLPALRVAVNLSARQFRDPGLVSSVERALEESGLDSACLELEITESTVMHDTKTAIETLATLKQLGVTLSVDDFGTGYSSLSYLKLFPIDVLKIDRSFVNDITTNPDDAAIVRAIVTLAHSLDLAVVAEGVEELAQAVFLRHAGCHECQGFYFSRPLPEAEAEQLLRGGLKLEIDRLVDELAGENPPLAECTHATQ